MIEKFQLVYTFRLSESLKVDQPLLIHLQLLAPKLTNIVTVNERLKVPVILLRALSIHRDVARELGRPEGAALRVSAEGLHPGIEVAFPQGKAIVVSGLDGPLAHEDGELAVARLAARVGIHVCGEVLGCDVATLEEVVVHVEDDVRVCGEVARPVLHGLEAALEHDRDARVDRRHTRDDCLDVFQDPGRAAVRDGGRSPEDGHILVAVRRLVDWCNGEGLRGGGVLNEIDHGVHDLQGVLQRGLIVEPPPMTRGFTDVETIHAAGERVKVDHNVHAVSLDGIVRDLLEILKLVSRIQLGSGKIDPGRVVGWYADDLNSSVSQLVDDSLRDVGGVSML